MKILKPGTIEQMNRVKRFGCLTCGCIFEADNTEYQPECFRNETYYNCECPCCGKSTSYEMERDEQ